MHRLRIAQVFPLLLITPLLLPAASAAQEVYEPKPGQAGKDVVWVPTPPEMVEKMLDMAQVTSQDFVMDLGSGDGRNLIAAGKRGARAVGVEYNPDMVALSQRLAKEQGVDDKVTFVQGDMFEADVSKATVLALFLLPSNLTKLQDKFVALRPGTRIVFNTFKVEGWEPDATESIADCTSWCTAYLMIVPAQVGGNWQFSGGTLSLSQQFQMVSGELVSRGNGGSSAARVSGKMAGDRIQLTVGEAEYAGRVQGDRIEGTITRSGKQQKWTARRVQ